MQTRLAQKYQRESLLFWTQVVSSLFYEHTRKISVEKKKMVIVFLFHWKAVPFWHTQMHVQSFNKDLFLISYSRQWAIFFFLVYLRIGTWCFSLPMSAMNLSYSMLALHCKTVIYVYGTKVWSLTTQ